jgi:hypothetical protein
VALCCGVISLSVLWEKQSRRPELALFTLSRSFDVAWNQCKQRGWVQPLPAGVVRLRMRTARFPMISCSYIPYTHVPLVLWFGSVWIVAATGVRVRRGDGFDDDVLPARANDLETHLHQVYAAAVRRQLNDGCKLIEPLQIQFRRLPHCTCSLSSTLV